MSAAPARQLPRPATPRPAAPRPQPATSPSRGRLRAVPEVRLGTAHARRAPFVILVCSLLAAGLVGVLVLNSLLTQNSYRIHNLQKTSSQLTDTEQALREQVGREASPQQLRQRATELGMVPAPNPVFVDQSGAVLGVPSPAPTPLPTQAPAQSPVQVPASGAGSGQ